MRFFNAFRMTYDKTMIIGNKKFENYTYIMAVINLTPDSFFAPSRKNEYTVLKAVERAVKDGASVIDLGAQSTRPDYAEISADEEMARLLPSLEAVKKNFDIPVSVDTYFSRCAKEALDAGADMINDVRGLTHDSDIAKVIALHNASVCIMHNSDTPLSGDIFTQITSFLKERVGYALNCGIEKDKILVDGGIGFAKSREQNFELLNGYERLDFGYPLLIGTSRKSMFGGKPEDRLEATVESTRVASRKKVLFVRVHDVKENARAIEEIYGN